MKYKTDSDNLFITAYEENGKYKLKISEYRTRGIYSKRGTYKTWITTVKTFDTAKQANGYFLAIKKKSSRFTQNLKNVLTHYYHNAIIQKRAEIQP